MTTPEPGSAQSNAAAGSSSSNFVFTSKRDQSAERRREELDERRRNIEEELGTVDRKILNNVHDYNGLWKYLVRRKELYEEAEENRKERKRDLERTLSYNAITGLRYDTLLATIESVADTVSTALDKEVEDFQIYADLSKNELRLIDLISEYERMFIIAEPRGSREFLTLDIKDRKKRWDVLPEDLPKLRGLLDRREKLFERLGRVRGSGNRERRRNKLRIGSAGAVIEKLNEWQDAACGDVKLISAGDVSKRLFCLPPCPC